MTAMARMISMATKSPKTPAQPPVPAIRPDDAGGGDSVVLERLPQKTKPPQMFQVVLLNDDYTPMEFAVGVNQEVFHTERDTTTKSILNIHLSGKGKCGVFSSN